MKKSLAAFVVALCLFTFNAFQATPAFADDAVTRIKDVTTVQGMRSNQLFGYGLVVGLNGTGDSTKSTETLQSVANMLRNFGVSVSTSGLQPKNVAAVMVTATLPPFAHEGDTINTTISSMGDAKSLTGGTLIQTPLQAANGEVYAVAQGPVSTGGYSAGGGGSSTQHNFPTVGTTTGGAIVEKSVNDTLGDNGTVSLTLSNPDFTTAERIASAINSQYGGVARATNPGRVEVSVPSYYSNNVVAFMAGLENLPIMPDNPARVVVNERTGTIVMGGNVSVDEVAITQGGISLNITRNANVNQPPPFSAGSTVVTPSTNVNAKPQKASSIVLPATANVNDIVGALNSVGATSQDIISILQALKASGALHAQLEII